MLLVTLIAACVALSAACASCYFAAVAYNRSQETDTDGRRANAAADRAAESSRTARAAAQRAEAQANRFPLITGGMPSRHRADDALPCRTPRAIEPQPEITPEGHVLHHAPSGPQHGIPDDTE